MDRDEILAEALAAAQGASSLVDVERAKLLFEISRELRLADRHDVEWAQKRAPRKKAKRRADRIPAAKGF